MTVAFEIDGQAFTALNGGPMYKFNEATSFVVHCKDQAEVDHYWSKLTEGGQEVQCGWLKDKYGLSWQITPTEYYDLVTEGDAASQDRLMAAVLYTTSGCAAKLRALHVDG